MVPGWGFFCTFCHAGSQDKGRGLSGQLPGHRDTDPSNNTHPLSTVEQAKRPKQGPSPLLSPACIPVLKTPELTCFPGRPKPGGPGSPFSPGGPGKATMGLSPSCSLDRAGHGSQGSPCQANTQDWGTPGQAWKGQPLLGKGYLRRDSGRTGKKRREVIRGLEHHAKESNVTLKQWGASEGLK